MKIVYCESQQFTGNTSCISPTPTPTPTATPTITPTKTTNLIPSPTPTKTTTPSTTPCNGCRQWYYNNPNAFDVTLRYNDCSNNTILLTVPKYTTGYTTCVLNKVDHLPLPSGSTLITQPWGPCCAYPTPTPTLTPTSTPSCADSCQRYILMNNTSGIIQFSYIDCNSNPSTATTMFYSSYEVCSKTLPSYSLESWMSAFTTPVTIVQSGCCSYPIPTPTPTPTPACPNGCNKFIITNNTATGIEYYYVDCNGITVTAITSSYYSSFEICATYIIGYKHEPWLNAYGPNPFVSTLSGCCGCDCYYFDAVILQNDIDSSTGNTLNPSFNGVVGFDFVPCGSNTIQTKLYYSAGTYTNDICISAIDYTVHNGYPNNGISYPNTNYWWSWYQKNNIGVVGNSGPFYSSNTTYSESYLVNTFSCCVEPSNTPTPTPTKTPTPTPTSTFISGITLTPTPTHTSTPTPSSNPVQTEIYRFISCCDSGTTIDLLVNKDYTNVVSYLNSCWYNSGSSGTTPINSAYTEVSSYSTCNSCSELNVGNYCVYEVVECCRQQAYWTILPFSSATPTTFYDSVTNLCYTYNGISGDTNNEFIKPTYFVGYDDCGICRNQSGLPPC